MIPPRATIGTPRNERICGCAARPPAAEARVGADVGRAVGLGRLAASRPSRPCVRGSGPIAAISSSLIPAVMKRANAALAVGHAERGVARVPELARRVARSACSTGSTSRSAAIASTTSDRVRSSCTAPDLNGGPNCSALPARHDGAIALETRELAIAPVRDGLMELIAARRPADGAALREFATAYLRRLSPDAAAETSARGALRRDHRRLRLRRRARRPADRSCACSTRPAPSTATSATARWSRRTRRTCPFLVDSVTGGARRRRAARRARDAPDRRARARRGRPHRRRPAPARGGGARVGHALRPRPPAGGRRARGAGRRRSAACWATSAARCSTSRRWPTAPGAWSSSPAPGAARYPDDEVDETVAFLEWLLQDHFIFLGYREYRIAEDTIARRPRLGPRHPRRRGLVGLRPAAAARGPAGRRARARARGRPADRLQDQPPLARAPARADGLRRRAARVGRRPDRRRGAHARPLHHQGLRRAGVADAAAQPQAAPDPAPRGPDRGLARLQGRGLAVRLLPEGRAVRGAGRRTCAAPSWRCSRSRAIGSGCSGRRSHDGRVGLADRRGARRRATTPSCSTRSARCCASASAPTRSTTTTVLGEHDQVRVHVTVHAPGGVPEVPLRELEQELIALTRTWDDDLRDQLVAAPRRDSPASELAARWGARFPRYYKASVAPSVAVADVALLRAARARRRAVRRRAAERAGAHARRALQARREGRARRGDADPRGPRPARHRGGPDAAARAATERRGCRTSACWGRAPGRWTSTPWASGWPTASRRSAAATPSPTRSTGS